MKIIISGGGTLGHLKPAIEIGKALKEENEILFLTDNDIYDFISHQGVSHKLIRISYFKKIFSFRFLVFPFRLAYAFFQTFLIFLKFCKQFLFRDEFL